MNSAVVRQGRSCFQQQRIARPQDNIANFLPQPLTTAGDGDDDGIIDGAEAPVANGLPNERIAIRHDRLDEAALGTRMFELEDLVGGGEEAAEALQSTTDSITPTNTSWSWHCKRSCGDTAASTSPLRSISARYTPGRWRSPACSIVWPISGLSSAVDISTVYSRHHRQC